MGYKEDDFYGTSSMLPASELQKHNDDAAAHPALLQLINDALKAAAGAEQTKKKNAPGGYAGLDASGKLLSSILPQITETLIGKGAVTEEKLSEELLKRLEGFVKSEEGKELSDNNFGDTELAAVRRIDGLSKLLATVVDNYVSKSTFNKHAQDGSIHVSSAQLDSAVKAVEGYAVGAASSAKDAANHAETAGVVAEGALGVLTNVESFTEAKMTEIQDQMKNLDTYAQNISQDAQRAEEARVAADEAAGVAYAAAEAAQSAAKEAADAAPAKQLKYYGDADIVPTDGSLFNVSSSGSVTAGNDLFLISVEKLVIPYIEGTTPVREIGENAFYNATPGTKEIIIPNGVTSIGKQAFRDLSVNYITIPRSVKTIGDYAFSGCDNLSTIYYGGSPSEWEQIQIGEGNDQIIPENMLAWIEYANEYALVSDLGDISSALDAINAIQDEMLGGEST